MRTSEQKHPRHPLEPRGPGVLVFLSLPFVFLGLLFFALACGDSETRGANIGDDSDDAERTSARVTPSEAPRETPPMRPAKPEPPTSSPKGSATQEGDTTSEPVPASFEESELAFHESRYGPATSGFAAYVERTPENPWGHYMLGLSAWKTGELDLAVEALRKTTELDPSHVKGWTNLARTLLDAERPREAREAATRAVDLDPDGNEPWRVLGRAAHEEGKTEEALEAYRRAILTNPDDAWSMNNLGLLHIERGEYGAAAETLARAVQLRDDVATFQNNLGVALERTERFAAAVNAYRAADELAGGYEKASASLARVEERAPMEPEADPAELQALAEAFVRTTEEWRSALVEIVNREPTEEEEAEARAAALPEPEDDPEPATPDTATTP